MARKCIECGKDVKDLQYKSNYGQMWYCSNKCYESGETSIEMDNRARYAE